MKKITDFFDSVNVRCVNFCQWFIGCIFCILYDALGSFHIGTVITAIFLEQMAMESSPIGVRSIYSWERLPPIIPESDATVTTSGIPARGKNTVVCFVADLIVTLQIFLGSVERISIFHSKFADTDQSGTRSCLITEL